MQPLDLNQFNQSATGRSLYLSVRMAVVDVALGRDGSGPTFKELMNGKLFEVRDAGMFIPVFAVKLGFSNEAERYLYRRAGFAVGESYVLLCRIAGGRGDCSTDSYDFQSRTMQVAHDYLSKHFDELEAGAVIDAEFILGISGNAKESERVSA